MTMKRATALALLLLQACSGGDDAQPVPAGGLLATVAVGDEVFRAQITHPDGMAQARSHWAGTTPHNNIVAGQLVCSAVAWNDPWHWHLAPESVRMVEATIELCDGSPSNVEANCPGFGGGQFCPWHAELINLQDCSTDPGCPAVPR